MFLYKFLSSRWRVQKIAKEIKEQIDEFRPHVSLIQALRDRGLRLRHWEEISYKTGIQISMTPNLTFRKCLEAGLGDYADVVVQVAESAGKEFALEQTLIKMQTEWESIVIELTAYKDTGTFIMKISDEVTQMLDDHLILTQQMSFSPFKGEFEEQLTEWEDKLHLTQFVLEEWMECQK
uniref:Dynein heavy chain linker domain-containing protein n=1 Tax=Timema bartmani TaxID=61472 RepID=A0A7R9FBS3_9NEOP|nr:unnamed protein product [Timema bartmani]